MEEPELLCHHVYSGKRDGGVVGMKCNKSESMHCKYRHCEIMRRKEHRGYVHHSFQRRPITGTYIVTLHHKIAVQCVVVDSIIVSADASLVKFIGQPIGNLFHFVKYATGSSLCRKLDT